MIDIGDKEIVPRAAVARGVIVLKPDTIGVVRAGNIRKGDALTVAKVSAVQAVKNTALSIPYCHPLPITAVDVDFEVKDDSITVTCKVRSLYSTGVEMEALCGVSAGLLTIWDMVKYLEKDGTGQYPHTMIKDVQVLSKSKGAE